MNDFYFNGNRCPGCEEIIYQSCIFHQCAVIPLADGEISCPRLDTLICASCYGFVLMIDGRAHCNKCEPTLRGGCRCEVPHILPRSTNPCLKSNLNYGKDDDDADEEAHE